MLPQPALSITRECSTFVILFINVVGGPFSHVAQITFKMVNVQTGPTASYCILHCNQSGKLFVPDNRAIVHSFGHTSFSSPAQPNQPASCYRPRSRGILALIPAKSHAKPSIAHQSNAISQAKPVRPSFILSLKRKQANTQASKKAQ